MQGFPVPAGMPARGLLAVDMVPGVFQGRVRWYPDPSESKAVQSADLGMVPRYEAKMEFGGGWSMRGLDWFDGVPEGDRELWDFMNDLEIRGASETMSFFGV